MKLKLISAVLITLLDELLILAILVLVLPAFGIHIPLLLVTTFLIIWTAFSIFLFFYTRKTFLQRPFRGLTDMTEMKGVVIADLKPEGLVKIGNEIWQARATDGDVSKGEEIIVEGRQGLILIVKKTARTNNGRFFSHSHPL